MTTSENPHRGQRSQNDVNDRSSQRTYPTNARTQHPIVTSIANDEKTFSSHGLRQKNIYSDKRTNERGRRRGVTEYKIHSNDSPSMTHVRRPIEFFREWVNERLIRAHQVQECTWAGVCPTARTSVNEWNDSRIEHIPASDIYPREMRLAFEKRSSWPQVQHVQWPMQLLIY